MSAHSLYSPSAAERWMSCPGSMVLHEGGKSSTFADDGTASHYWGALCLTEGRDASWWNEATQEINGVHYVMTEERADYVQMYLDDVRRRAMGGLLFVEQRVDLSDFLGDDQGGTADVAIVQPEESLLVVEDLKYGTGQKVYASYPAPTAAAPKRRRANKQLGLYALGFLKAARMFGDITRVRLVVCQPRLGHIDEYDCTIEELMELAHDARIAVEDAGRAMLLGADDPALDDYCHPSEKGCMWCDGKSRCRKLARFVADAVRMEFDVIPAEQPAIPQDTGALTTAMNAVPLIEQWCRSIRHEVDRRVRDGQEVLGSDGLPYKLVEGKQGNREWIDDSAATAALLGQLPVDKAYKPAEIITASAASKLLDKKATKQLWKDVFVPLIRRAPGKPTLALGSDERPPFAGTAGADEFDEIVEE